jgi:hypothetical protein
MRDAIQIIVGAITGAFSGALFGALLLGVQTYMDTSSGWLGTARSWTGMAVLMGIICGGVPGLVIGGVIGVFKFGAGYGALTGTAMGLLIAAYLFSATTHLDKEVRLAGALSIPAGALVGLIAAWVVGLLRAPSLP